MKQKFLFLYLIVLIFIGYTGFSQNKSSKELVYQDKEGVIRWSKNAKEVALFGANYCLPSACDYRAAKYVTNDLKKVVDADMAIIAAEVMKNIPRLKNYGNYPTNTSFGPFRISYEQDLGEMNTADKFIYANNTSSTPQNSTALKTIVGNGSSPVVKYEGQGIYFLDKIKNGTWRLEVYPDAVEVKDPFNMPSPEKIVFRSMHKAWPMKVSLLDLGNAFSVLPLNTNNSYSTSAADEKFIIQPGVYILTADKNFKKETLPGSIGFVGMKEFFSPDDQQLPTQVVPNYQPSYYSGKPITITANVYGNREPETVTLFMKGGRGFFPVPMKKASVYRYKAEIPANRSTEGWIEYCIVVKDGNTVINYPSGINKSPADWDYIDAGTWKSVVVKEKIPLRLLNPAEDVDQLAFTRIGDAIRFGIYKMIPSTQTGEASFHLELPLTYDRNLRDYTLSVPVKEKIGSRKADIAGAKTLVLNARGINQQQQAYITLVENDGTSWSKKILLQPDWNNIQIPLNELELSKGVMLPLGYPGEWKYWFEPADGRGKAGDHVKMENVEWIQLSIRQSDMKKEEAKSNSWIDISSAIIQF